MPLKANQVFIFIILIGFSEQGEWARPPFLENEAEKDQVWLEDSPGKPIIYMNENIDYFIIIAFFNYDGNETPKIGDFYDSNASNKTLGVVISKKDESDNGKWGLKVTLPQDYENIESYLFEVIVGGDILIVTLHINNLDDNKPVITVTQNPCTVEENFIGPSNCSYSISDDDGIMDLTVIYTIEAEENLASTFEFKNEPPLENKLKNWTIILCTLKPLDFIQVQVYTFKLIVTDSGNNKGSAEIIIQVKNMPLRDPVWKTIVPLKQFDEKTEQTFQVEAYDGDVQINNEINYKIETDRNDLFSIDSKTGNIYIKKIDRDALKIDVFQMTVIAFEVPSPEFKTSQSITIIVNDINDNSPTVELIGEQPLKINESTATTLQLDVNVTDIDLGENAMFKVFLKCDKTTIDYSKAFQIIPNQGYQNWIFQISTTDISQLDYEDSEWRNFEFQVFAIENSNSSHVDQKDIHIQLQNLNDELPYFLKDEYQVSIPENVDIDQSIAIVLAKDNDYDDIVKHEIIGNSSKKIFSIDPLSGVITTRVENALDYETLPNVFVSVQAQDSLLGVHHNAYTQLEIIVLDVNDERPTIRPTEAIATEENQAHGTSINLGKEVIAEDVDTEAYMTFSIVWDTSFATKNGQTVAKKEFQDCLRVETIRDPENNKLVKALLTINEIRKSNTPDYEVYDTLNIRLKVVDENQTILPNEMEALLIINVQDLNDNSPKFDKESYAFTVTENSVNDTFINKISATDADGPKFNNVTFSLEPSDSATPKDWVSIDALNGTVFVSGKIDADEPPIWSLNYTVTATDGENIKSVTLTVGVIDENDNPPIIEFDQQVEIDEKSDTSTLVQTLTASDLDRDEMYNTPWFRFSPFIGEAQKLLFSIDLKNGSVYVDLKSNEILDRDNGPDTYEIRFRYGDNLNLEGSQRQNSEESSFTVKLNDINDNAPIISTTNIKASEDLKKGTKLSDVVEAHDNDERGTQNSQINFRIKSVAKGEGAVKEPHQDMFSIETKDVNSGIADIILNYDLREFYGTYDVVIEAYDLGIKPNSSNKTVFINVSKYNFKPPKFILPEPNEIFYLSKKQDLHSTLKQYNNSELNYISATDEQNEKWDLKFSILQETNPDETFYLSSNLKNTAELRLNTPPKFNLNYTLTLNANCDCVGEKPFDTNTTVRIRFVDLDTEPFFETDEVVQDLSFTENKTGIDEVRQLYRASYSENGEEWDIFPIFYFLLSDSMNMSKHFEIHKTNAELKLKTMLDREEMEQFTLQVVASKKNDGVIEPDLRSVLSVNVTVIDVNDNPPNFQEKEYTAVVTTTVGIGDKVRTVMATDLDKDDILTYLILNDTLKTNGSGISGLSTPFLISSLKGDILANFKVLDSMSGSFSFTIKVLDFVEHADTATVIVYIVVDKNKSVFKFENPIEDVERKNEEIKKILEAEFPELTCNIDKIQKAKAQNGEALNNETEVSVYFIDKKTQTPLDNVEFQRILNYDTYYKLKSEFLKEGLNLVSLSEKSEPTQSKSKAPYIFLGIAIALAVLCVALVAFFIFKVRSLHRQIKSLRTSVDSSLDATIGNIGMAAPNTNKHVFQGSNPVFNHEKNEKQLDGLSVGSGDSDLIGIEDDPAFDTKPSYTLGNKFNKNDEEDC